MITSLTSNIITVNYSSWNTVLIWFPEYHIFLVSLLSHWTVLLFVLLCRSFHVACLTNVQYALWLSLCFSSPSSFTYLVISSIFIAWTSLSSECQTPIYSWLLNGSIWVSKKYLTLCVFKFEFLTLPLKPALLSVISPPWYMAPSSFFQLLRLSTWSQSTFFSFSYTYIWDVSTSVSSIFRIHPGHDNFLPTPLLPPCLSHHRLSHRLQQPPIGFPAS